MTSLPENKNDRKLTKPQKTLSTKRSKTPNGEVSAEEIFDNKTAVKMVLDSHKKIEKENKTLKKELTNLNLTVEETRNQKRNGQIAIVLANIANIMIGFGVNLITGDKVKEGLMVFIPGVILVIMGIYFARKK